MALTRDEAIATARECVRRLAVHHDIREAFLFGSYATGNDRDSSDVDVAVVLGERTVRGNSATEQFEVYHEAQKFNCLVEVVSFLHDGFAREEIPVIRRIREDGIRLSPERQKPLQDLSRA